MLADVKHQWRRAGWVTVFAGIWVGLSLVGDVALGLNQAYFTEAYRGVAPPLVFAETQSQYAAFTLFAICIFLVRLLLGALALGLLRDCLLASRHRISQQVVQIALIGMVVSALFLFMVQIQAHLYALDADRYQFIILVKVGNLGYSLMIQLGMMAILYGAYRGRLIPRPWLAISAFIALCSFIYTLFATHPSLQQFMGGMIAYISALILALYLLVAEPKLSQTPVPITNANTVTPLPNAEDEFRTVIAVTKTPTTKP